MKLKTKLLICREHDSFRKKIVVHDSFFSRLAGLMFRKDLEKDTGILLKPCSEIHTFFMKFTIDVIYLDKKMRVVQKACFEPGKIGKRVKGCESIIELNKGEANSLEIGDLLELVDC